jgi:hypothetical protein
MMGIPVGGATDSRTGNVLEELANNNTGNAHHNYTCIHTAARTSYRYDGTGRLIIVNPFSWPGRLN